MEMIPGKLTKNRDLNEMAKKNDRNEGNESLKFVKLNLWESGDFQLRSIFFQRSLYMFISSLMLDLCLGWKMSRLSPTSPCSTSMIAAERLPIVYSK